MVKDTIVAIATAPGEGAIGIVRMSGNQALSILDLVFQAKSKKSALEMKNRMLYYGHITDETHVIDEVLVTKMLAPNTYTCEDVVEINCHGGIVPLQETVKLLLRRGARMAEPGEFTKRAFLNGRLDLAQAESVMDLISAKTPRGFTVAYQQLEGALSKRVGQLRNELLNVMAQLEVSIDYPDVDEEEITFAEIRKRFESVQTGVEDLLASSETGRIIRDGLSTVIVGKPNVGKSSLMNALLRESRAIVTDIPGTTRDVLEEFINVKGVPLRIIDTAGIRQTEDVVEKIGVERSKEFFNKADLIVFVINAAEPLTEEDESIIELLEGRKALIVVNKVDLPRVVDQDQLEERLPNQTFVYTSMMDDNGIEDVENTIAEFVFGGHVIRKENAYVSNIRHINALERTQTALNAAINAVDGMMPYDFIEVDTKDAYAFLGEISGDTVEDDLVTRIFSNFCLGK